VKKPADIIHGVDDAPPIAIGILNALQHVAIMAVYLIFPVIVCRAANASPATTGAVVSLAMLVMGVATLLQVARTRWLGSGYLCPAVFSATYIDAAIAAVHLGGLPLVFGMTTFAGLAESALSGILHRLRPYFPAEVAGLVVMLVGISNAGVGVSDIMAQLHRSGDGRVVLTIAMASLASMVALNVWTRGLARMLCALIGIAVGYALAAWFGLFHGADFGTGHWFAWIELPTLSYLSWSFNLALALPFLVSAMAAALKAMAVLSMCQKINDDEWIRPDMPNLQRGVAADGIGTLIAGLLGTFGVNSSSTCVGLSAASGVTSRYIAYAIAGIFIVTAFIPGIATVLAAMPRPVIAAALIFTSCFLLINGMQTVTSRMLDSRKTFVVGLTIVGGLAVQAFPNLGIGTPAAMRPILSSSLVFGTLLAFMLNLVFRLGIRQKVTLVCQASDGPRLGSDDFLELNGAKWGARRDVIHRAQFALHQAIDVIIHDFGITTPVRIEASFDEFNLDLAIAYDGELLELPEQRPSDEEIRDSLEGVHRLAGYMLRRNADRARSEHAGGKSILKFHFNH